MQVLVSPCENVPCDEDLPDQTLTPTEFRSVELHQSALSHGSSYLQPLEIARTLGNAECRKSRGDRARRDQHTSVPSTPQGLHLVGDSRNRGKVHAAIR